MIHRIAYRLNGKKVQLLFEKMRKDLEMKISKDAYIVRLRPGHHQRSAGAWSWCLFNSDDKTIHGFGGCGSQWSINELLKSKTIVESGGDIDPDP